MVDATGAPIMCEDCPCDFLGTGWYCVSLFRGLYCSTLVLITTECSNITTPTGWDDYQFGVCRLQFEYIMLTTDGVKHATQALCEADCALYP